MIGTQIRGFRHLCRSVGDRNVRKILLVGGRNSLVRVFVKKTTNSKNKYVSVFISEYHGNNTPPSWLTTEDSERIAKSLGNSQFFYTEVRSSHEYQAYCNYSILLPDNILDEVDKFLSQNKKLCESTVSRYCNAHDYASLLFYVMSNASPNYYSWALNNVFKHSATYQSVKNCLMLIDDYPQIVKKLSKGTPIAYNGLKAITELYEELVMLRRDKRLNDVVNMFNTCQKKLLKNHAFSDNEVDTISKFYVLSPEKQNNFVRKMSTIDDTNEIMHQMSLLTKSQFSWNKESVLEFINNAEGIKCQVVFDKGDTLVVRVDNYEAIKYLAKTTNWCISKNKTYWNNYTNAKRVSQYVLFDFSKKEDDKVSIVGFTVNDGRFISHAHNFVNDNIVQDHSEIKEQVRQFIPKSVNIFDVLKSNKVNSNIFLRKREYPFEWNKMSLVDYINSNEDEENVDIIYNEGDKLAVIMYGTNFYNLFSNSEMRHGLGIPCDTKVFLFADFSEPIEDGFTYCNIIQPRTDSANEVPDKVRKLYGFGIDSISFNDTLKKFNLPLNSIKRVYDEKEEFLDAVRDCDIETMSKLLSKDGFIEELKRGDAMYRNKLSSCIHDSLFSFYTLDVINLIYSHGLTLSEITAPIEVAMLINECVEFIASNLNQLRNERIDLLDDYERIFKPNNMRIQQLFVYGLMYAIKMVSDNETDKNIGHSIEIEPFSNLGRNRNFRIEIINMIIKYIVGIKAKLDKCINFIVNDDNVNAMRVIIKSSPSASIIHKLINSLPKEHEIVQSVSMAK